MTASSTVLTCGKLRISVPADARTPSLRVLPGSGSVEISFANFCGNVLFEMIEDSEEDQRTSSVLPVKDHSQNAMQVSAPSAESMPPSQSSAPLSTEQPPLSQPLPSQVLPASSQPLIAKPQELLDPSQVLASASQSLSLSQPSSDINPLPASQPLPLSQQLSQPLLTPPFPATQLPDESMGSQPPQPAQPAEHYNQFMPLTPPSSDDEEPDGPPDDDFVISTSLAKRPAPRPEHLPVKQGKRVRFQKDPEYFSQSPLQSQSPQKEKSLDNALVEKESTQPKPSPWNRIEMTGEVPARRWGATFTKLNDDTIILLGGESESEGFFRDMTMLEVSKTKWTRSPKDTPDMPCSGRAWHTTTCVDQSLFVFGGEKEVDGERTQTNDVLMYDTSYFTWFPPALSGTAPSPRAGHSAAPLPDSKSVVIYGGIHKNKWLNDLYLLEDMSSWSKVRLSSKSAKPAARSYATLTPASGFLILFGGNNKTKCFNDVYLLNPKDLAWKETVILGRKPRARTGHCAMTSKDGKSVIVYGGWDDQGIHRHFYSDVWELRIKSQTDMQWVCLYSGDNATKMPGPRAGAALERGGGKMLLFGGWHQVSYFNDITELVLPFTIRPCAAVKSNA